MASRRVTGRRARFRVGTTSYILPDRILPNVRYLAGRVDDVELLLFEVGEAGDGLPTRDEVEELRALAIAHDVGYTVHLPLSLRLGGVGARWRRDVDLACRVIEATRELDPWSWIVHVEADFGIPAAIRDEQAVRALIRLTDATGEASRLAVENLEGAPPGRLDTVVGEAGVSRCVDIGHLWLDGHSPVPFLETALARTRVVHLHGVGERDHASLAEQELGDVVDVLEPLVRRAWGGVLTLEVFGREELASSRRVLVQALAQAERRVSVA